MDILFINHKKSQCGIYELGVRIYELLDKRVFDIGYFEISNLDELQQQVQIYKPKYIIYNYNWMTLPWANIPVEQGPPWRGAHHKMFPNIKHIGIVHDPLGNMVEGYDNKFDAWIIHDDTNQSISSKKFTTVRPIRRFERKFEIDKKNMEEISIGTHGFNTSGWKCYDHIINCIQKDFDEVTINMNISQATFGNQNQLDDVEKWKKIIYKPGIKINITNNYFKTEIELIEFLSKNTMNIYFYKAPNESIGVGASADLAVSSQSSLVVNSTYMYRHFHSHIGYYEMANNLKTFLNNNNKIKELYNLWSPEKITMDYKKMIESL